MSEGKIKCNARRLPQCGEWLRRIAWLLLIAVLAFFTWRMALITSQYWPVGRDVAFLRIKQHYIGILHWEAAFWIHVAVSMIPLLAGFTQFARWILKSHPRVHRFMGKTYVISVCLVTGPASLIMAFYANGGVTSRLAFGSLAVLWIFTTAMGWRMAMKRMWPTHREWMIRSYALTLSAITLRVWKYGIVMAFAPPPMDVYRIVAWLGFIPNLLLAEWIIRRGKKVTNMKNLLTGLRSYKMDTETFPPTLIELFPDYIDVDPKIDKRFWTQRIEKEEPRAWFYFPEAGSLPKEDFSEVGNDFRILIAEAEPIEGTRNVGLVSGEITKITEEQFREAIRRQIEALNAK